MDPITPRNRNGLDEPGVYWRRRLFALTAGLAVLGLLAWAVGGASSSRPAATTASLTGQTPLPSIAPAAVSPSPFASSPSAGPSPSPSATSPSPSPSASAAPAGGAKSTPTPVKAAARAQRAGHPPAARPHGSGCLASDVVISLTMNGDSFGATARPGFGIDVVSTDRATCTLNLGTKHLTLVISSGGVRAWGSGDCAVGAGSAVTKLPRGVPAQRSITWHRVLSSPGCKTAHTAARPGTYTAVAYDGSLHSQTLVFVLR